MQSGERRMSEGASVFNEEAERRLKSPDDVDEYIRISSPSVMLILCACVALLLGILAWGLFGSVTTSVTAKGAVIDGKALCFLDEEDAQKLHVGDNASMGGASLAVASIPEAPVSRKTAAQLMDDEYLLDAVMTTVRNCDRILVFDGGRVAEEGTYEEPIDRGGLFADLVAKQLLETQPAVKADQS